MRQLLIALLLVLTGPAQPPGEPVVRIGLGQNAAAVTIRSASEFSVDQHRTRAATFTTALAVDAAGGGSLKKSDLQYRVTVTLDAETVLVLPAGTRVRIEPAGAPLEIESRTYRGTLDVFGNA